MTWLDRLMDITDKAESPRIYFYWAGLAALSACISNKLYLDKHYYKLYPNIYVMLIGKSGLRKGVPVSLAKTLVEHANSTRVIAGRNSVQAIIQELSRARTFEDRTEPLKDAIGFLVSGEFASFMVQDPQALTILTDLYDGHYNAEWKNTLKTSGTETLKNVCLTLLGAANPTHFRDAVPANAVGGGFVARTLLVYATEKNNANSLSRETKKYDIEQLIKDLHHKARISGEFKWTEPAQDLYDDWYYKFNPDNDPTGTADRLHDHILKVAMLISLSRSDSLLLEKIDIEEAIDACTLTVSSANKVTHGRGENKLAHIAVTIIEECLKRPENTVERKVLLRNHWGSMDAIDLDKTISTLEQGQLIETKWNGGNTTYTLTPRAIEYYESKKQGKQ